MNMMTIMKIVRDGKYNKICGEICSRVRHMHIINLVFLAPKHVLQHTILKPHNKRKTWVDNHIEEQKNKKKKKKKTANADRTAAIFMLIMAVVH